VTPQYGRERQFFKNFTAVSWHFSFLSFPFVCKLNVIEDKLRTFYLTISAPGPVFFSGRSLVRDQALRTLILCCHVEELIRHQMLMTVKLPSSGAIVRLAVSYDYVHSLQLLVASRRVSFLVFNQYVSARATAFV
jgi:hypothetical protein